MATERLQLASTPIGDLLAALGDKTPAPGGGAVASITLALASHLARMVVNYSIGKKNLAEHAGMHGEALASLQALGEGALELAEEDAAAYGRLNALWKLDKDDAERTAHWDDAVDAAIAAPMRVVEACVSLIEQLRELPNASNTHLLSDLGIAAVLTEAAARAAAWNVAINLPLVGDAGRAAAIREEAEHAVTHVRNLAAAVESACRR